MSLFDWIRRRRQIDDVADEIQSHLAMDAQDRIANGDDPETARRAARRDFGNVTLAIEDGRRMWSSWWIDACGDVWKDVRHTVQGLARSPGFSFIVVAVLALGIGLNASVFTLFKSLALNPLAGVEDSGNLAVIMSRTSGGRLQGLSYPDYRYIRDNNSAFGEVSGSNATGLTLGLGRGAERVWGELVTGNYFQLFGVQAQLGRILQPSDEVSPGSHPVVVLSHNLWQRSFEGSPDVLGKTVHVNSYPMTVVGVVDPGFHGSVVGWDVEVFVPIMMAPQLGLRFRDRPEALLYDRTMPVLHAYGRPQPGITLEGASAEATALSAQLAIDAPAQDYSRRLAVLPIWESPIGAQTYMLPAIVVTGAMGVLLLAIVCANLAGLVLVHGISRRGEIAVRLALGAGRLRVLRLLLIESLALAVPGAAIGVFLAARMLPAMMRLGGASAPGRVFFDLSVDHTVIAYAAGAAFVSVLLFGFLPALRSSRPELVSVIKDDLSTHSSAKGRFRAALVVSQVAVSLLLLVGAGLVTRSLDAAQRADTGFDPQNVTSIAVNLESSDYDETRGRRFYEQLLDNVRSNRGIDSAGLAAVYPMTLVDSGRRGVVIEGYPARRDEDMAFLYNVVSPGYFRTLRIGIVSGREFTRDDDRQAPQVAIVNDTLASRFWGSPQNAIGKRLRADSSEWRTIVGVVRNIKYARINEDPRPYVYLPFLQSYQPAMILHARGATALTTPLDLGRSEILKLDPDMPILDAGMLVDQTRGALSILAMTAGMLLVLGMAAMGLAALGIYGLVSYAARQSTHEIGIRMALGATRGNVVRQFLKRGMRLGLTGAVVGLALSFAATRMLVSLLYGVSATDAVSFASALVLVLACTLIAGAVPAWRASRTDPIAALRHN